MQDTDSIDLLLKEIEKMSTAMNKRNYNYFKIKSELAPTGLCFGGRGRRRKAA